MTTLPVIPNPRVMTSAVPSKENVIFPQHNQLNISLNSQTPYDKTNSNVVLQTSHLNPQKLEDVKITNSFSNQDIQHFLEKKGIKPVGDTNYDACLFQAVLFTEFFKKIEKGEIDQNDPHFIKVRNYCLKKQLELLQNLRKKSDEVIGIAWESTSFASAMPSKNLADLQSWSEKLKTGLVFLEKEFLETVNNRENYIPNREKICLFIFIHAALTDCAKAIKSFNLFKNMIPESSDLISKIFKSLEKTNPFIGEINPLEKKLLIKALIYKEGQEALNPSCHALPCFSKTGSQGISTILYALFRGKKLFSGATDPHPVHNGYYNSYCISTLRHDVEHLCNILGVNFFSKFRTCFKEIFEKRLSELPGTEKKKDLVLMFHFLHESTETLVALSHFAPNHMRNRTFLEGVRSFLNRTFVAADLIPILKDLGFDLPELQENDIENKELFEAMAQAMNTLWLNFRKRHQDLLEKSDLKKQIPGYFRE